MLFTIIDIETTGFKRGLANPADNDDILEVGYIQVNEKLQILRHGVFYFYQDDFVLKAGAERVHKLSKEFLKSHKQEFDESLVKLYTLMQQGIIVGKNNIEFDTPFIQDFLHRRGKGLPEVSVVNQVDLQDIFTPIFRRWYKEKYNENTRRKGELEELMAVIGKEVSEVESEFMELFPDAADRCNAHSALYDVYMTYLLLDYAVKDGLDLSYYTEEPTKDSAYKYVSTKCESLFQDILDSRLQHPEVTRCMDIDLGDQLGKVFTSFMSVMDIEEYGPNIGHDLTEMQDMVTLSNRNAFGDTLVNRKEGIIHKYYSSASGELMFIVPYVLSGLLVIDYMNHDDLIITMAKCLAAFAGILTYDDLKSDLNPITPFVIDGKREPYDFFCDYIDYRKNVLGIPTNIEYESDELFGYIKANNMNAFWQKLIPSTGFMIREYLSGRILNSPGMLSHVLELIRLRRGKTGVTGNRV